MIRKNPVAFHFRNTKNPERGGVTVVYNPETNRFGAAVCNRDDNFRRKEGFTRALTRSKFKRSKHCFTGESSVSPEMSIEKLRLEARAIAQKAQTDYNNWVISKAQRVHQKVDQWESEFKLDLDIWPVPF